METASRMAASRTGDPPQFARSSNECAILGRSATLKDLLLVRRDPHPVSRDIVIRLYYQRPQSGSLTEVLADAAPLAVNDALRLAPFLLDAK